MAVGMSHPLQGIYDHQNDTGDILILQIKFLPQKLTLFKLPIWSLVTA